MIPVLSTRTLRAFRSALVAVAILSCAVSAFAATITVTNLHSDGPGSLVAAVAGAAPGDTIVFGEDAFGTIDLAAPLTIDKDLNIVGPTIYEEIRAGIRGAFVVFIVNSGVTVNISGLAISHGASSLGGGIFNAGTLTLTDVILDSNFADFGFETDRGGGIFNIGTLTVRRGSFLRNVAREGAGIYNYRGTVTIDQTTFDHGNATESGGGLFNDDGTVNVTDSKFDRNVAGTGGGVFNAGHMTMTTSTLEANEAFQGGGGVFNDGTMTVSRSTFFSNFGGHGFATPEGAIVREGTGGAAIWNFGGSLDLVNSTIAMNSSDGLLGAGGILNDAALTVSNSTIGTNDNGRLPSPPGGGIVNTASVILKNSILAYHADYGNCVDLSSRSSLPVSWSQGHNLSDDATCAPFLAQPGDLNSTPSGLDPLVLSDNGGPTATWALLPTSPAINAIPVASCTDVRGRSIATDQRGVPRPQGPACDIGAFEYFQSRFGVLAVQTFIIIDQVHASSLPPGPQQGLVAPLQAAVDSLNRGDVKPAVNQLGAFINETAALVRRGVLGSDEATALTTPARAIIATLTSGPPNVRP